MRRISCQWKILLPGPIIFRGDYNVKAKLAEMSQAQSEAMVLASEIDDLLVDQKEQLANEKDAKKKEQLNVQMTKFQQANAELRAALTAYDALIKKLLSPDQAMATLLRDLTIWEKLKVSNSYLLLVSVLDAAASSFTEKNIATSIFGKMPFYVSGGAVVSYAVFRGNDGAILESRILPIHSGFHSVKDLSNEFAISPCLTKEGC